MVLATYERPTSSRIIDPWPRHPYGSQLP